MHVAVIGSRGFPYVYSGYETFVAELAPRLVARGHQVTVYCHRELFDRTPAEVQGVRLVYTRGLKGKSLSQMTHSLTASVALLRRDRPDAVLFVNSANGPFGALMKAAGIRSAINVDGLEWLRPKWRGLGAAYFRTSSWLATRTFDLVVTDAQAMADVYAREFGAASTVIAYGATPAWPESPESVRELGLEPGGYYLVVGRLVPDNNADLILRGFVRSRSRRKLVVVGDVPYQDAYASAVRGLGDDRTVFLGYVRDQRLLKELYCHAYAYLHGHEYGGTNPTLLTALATGCCVLALDTPFSREVLDGERHALYFAKRPESVLSAIATADGDPTRVADFRARARDRIAHAYTWERITDQYEHALMALAR
jgi:glycosyltransferase involved in cell wall biosynthesis